MRYLEEIDQWKAAHAERSRKVIELSEECDVRIKLHNASEARCRRLEALLREVRGHNLNCCPEAAQLTSRIDAALSAVGGEGE